MPAQHDLSIRQLQYIVAVADRGGFRKAADYCHVSQPALSAQIQQIESVLEVKLFERDRKRVMLTPAGEDLVARARRVLVAVDDLLAAARRASDPFAGTLRLGVIPTVAPYLLPDVTPALTRRFPKLRLVFHEAKTGDVVRDLNEGKLDAALVALVDELGDVAHAEVLKDPFVVALPKNHPLARRQRVHADDLEDVEVLLLDDGHCFRSQALELCSKVGARETDLRATSLATLVQMVSAGAGVTLLPKLAVETENRRAQLEIRPFVAPVPSRTIALIWRRQSPSAEALGSVAKVLAEAARARKD